MTLSRKKRKEVQRRQQKQLEYAKTVAHQPRAEEMLFRNEGRTYIQLGDGFEFIMERPHERIVHMMKLSSAGVYDLVEKKWIKYRSSIFKVGDELHCKFFPRHEDRPAKFNDAPVLTYDDLVTLGYMYDAGEDSMARYRFDYIAYTIRRRKAKIIFDDVKAEENETGSITT